MEVVEKSIGTCRRWNRKKLICHVITLNLKHRNSIFYSVRSDNDNLAPPEQTVCGAIHTTASGKRALLCLLLLLLREHWPCEKRNGAHISLLVLSAGPERLTERFAHSENPAWKAGPRPCPLPAMGFRTAFSFGDKRMSEEEQTC